jgi:hypothetical protein
MTVSFSFRNIPLKPIHRSTVVEVFLNWRPESESEMVEGAYFSGGDSPP